MELAAAEAGRDRSGVSDVTLGRLVTHLHDGTDWQGPIVWLVHWDGADAAWICIDAVNEQLACLVTSQG